MKQIIGLLLLALGISMSIEAFDGDLRGKTCVVTGGTSGIGKEVALLFARHHCKVIVAARNRGSFTAMMNEGQGENQQLPISFSFLDLSSLKSVLTFIDDIQQKNNSVDILINNAGIFQKDLVTTENGLESTFQVNYLSQFLLTNKLLEKGIIASDARILNIVSERLEIFPLDKDVLSKPEGGVNWSHLIPGDSAYARSKLMLLMYSYKLAREAENKYPNMTIRAFHPGGVKTKIYDNLPLGLGKIAKIFMNKPEDVAKKIYDLMVDNQGKDVLIGTKLSKDIKKFAIDEENQNILWLTSNSILEPIKI